MAKVIWQEKDQIESLKFNDDHEAAAFALRLSRDDGILCALNTTEGRLVRHEPKTGVAQLIS